jgi:AcrR family transcriptional regulator
MGRHKQISDIEVLAVARDVFRAQGHSASTREIAAKAGLSQATLFQRFGDKSALFQAAMTPEPLDIELIMEPAAQGGLPVREQATEIAARLVEQISARLPQVVRLASDPHSGAGAIEAAHSRIGVESLRKALGAYFVERQNALQISPQTHSADWIEAFLLIVHGLAFNILMVPMDAASIRTALRSPLAVLVGDAPAPNRRSPRK